MSKELITAAALYLEKGLRIIALDGKAPNGAVHPHGMKDAYTVMPPTVVNQGILAAAFSHPRTTGIGILTGYPYFVVDIDGEEGAQQWLDILGPGSNYVPDRWAATTGRGLHLWFSDTTQRTTRKLGPKLDLKAEGGYVAAPPSVHPSGSIYKWIADPDQPPMEAPASLRRLLDTQDFERDQRIVAKSASNRVRHVYEPGSGVFYASWGFEGVLSAMREAEEGNRNAVLYWAACTLGDDGATEEDYDQLQEAALKAGLTRHEVRLTMSSARGRG